MDYKNYKELLNTKIEKYNMLNDEINSIELNISINEEAIFSEKKLLKDLQIKKELGNKGLEKELNICINKIKEIEENNKSLKSTHEIKQGALEILTKKIDELRPIEKNHLKTIYSKKGLYIIERLLEKLNDIEEVEQLFSELEVHRNNFIKEIPKVNTDDRDFAELKHTKFTIKHQFDYDVEQEKQNTFDVNLLKKFVEYRKKQFLSIKRRNEIFTQITEEYKY